MKNPNINPNDYPFEYDSRLFELMAHNFVPVDATELYKTIPEHEQILTSLIAAGFLSAKSTFTEKVTTWFPHIIITKSGIAYKNNWGFNWFYYWSIIKPLKFRWMEVRVEGDSLLINHRLIKKKIYSKDIFKIIQKNFSPFCKMVAKNHFGFIKEMEQYTKDINLVKTRISARGFENFLTECKIYSGSGFSKKFLTLTENIKGIIPTEYSNDILVLQAKSHNSLGNPKKALEIYNQILENDPYNLETQMLMISTNYYASQQSTPKKIKKEANKSYSKGEKLATRGEYLEAIKFYDEAINLYPYAGFFWEKKIKALRLLGRDDDAKDCYQKGLEYIPDKILDES